MRVDRPWLAEMINRIERDRRRPDYVPPRSDRAEVVLPISVWERVPDWLHREIELCATEMRRTATGIAFVTTTGRYRDWLARLQKEGWK